MTLPGGADGWSAVVWGDPKTGSLRIAGLTLLDRLLVALHRAGCASISVVGNGEIPPVTRSRALGVPFQMIPAFPLAQGPVLVAEMNLLVQTADVRAVIAGGGRLLDTHGGELNIGWLPALESDIEAALRLRTGIRATGVAGGVKDGADARVMERCLWGSLSSSSDGVVDKYFNRPLGRYLSKALVHTSVTPNQVTVAAALIGLLSAYFFAQGTRAGGLIGAVLLQLSAAVDCVDGDLARVAFRESRLGQWLDITLDQVVHIAVFGAIGAGLWRQGFDESVLWLGSSAIVGTLIAFPIVVRGQWLAKKRNDRRLERFIEAASTRDFTALILALAAIGKLQWFLWLTGVTVHVFWITAWWLQFPKTPRVDSQRGGSA